MISGLLYHPDMFPFIPQEVNVLWISFLIYFWKKKYIYIDPGKNFMSLTHIKWFQNSFWTLKVTLIMNFIEEKKNYSDFSGYLKSFPLKMTE